MRYVITPTLTGDLLYDWHVVSDRYDDPYIDPRIIAAVQETVADGRRFSNVIVYDDDDIPAAVASFFAERADFLLMCHRACAALPNECAVYGRCSSASRCSFVGCPPRPVGINYACGRASIHGKLPRRSIEPGPNCVARLGVGPACMEFANDDIAQWQPLSDLGYVCADSQPMYVLPAEGRTFGNTWAYEEPLSIAHHAVATKVRGRRYSRRASHRPQGSGESLYR